jgi:hypothetical protein
MSGLSKVMRGWLYPKQRTHPPAQETSRKG